MGAVQAIAPEDWFDSLPRADSLVSATPNSPAAAPSTPSDWFDTLPVEPASVAAEPAEDNGQMKGGWREPAMVVSNFAKGVIAAVPGAIDMAAGADKRNMDTLKSVFTGKRPADFGVSEPIVSNAVLGETQKLGITDRPDLEPQDFGEKLLAGGAQGAGAMSLAGPKAILPGLTGGMGAATAHELAPDSQIAPIIGGIMAGGIPKLGSLGSRATINLTRPISDRLARAINPETATKNQSLRQIAGAMTDDAKAGGPTPQQMIDQISASPNAPLNLTDVGGENLKGLAGQVSRTPGPGRQVMTNALKSRDAEAGTRLISSVDSGIGNGDVNETAQKIMQQRSAAATPLYQKAGIPSDPAEYGNAPLVDNPALTRLLTKSKDVRTAITAAKELPDYADLPDNSMVLLDKAYKNVGGMANQAKVAGNGESARDLNSLRTQLLRAITGDQENHPYKQALDAYSGPSQSLSALEDGRSIFTKAPSEIKQDLAGLSPADQQFYKIGAAGAIRTNISRTSSGGNEALRITGNNYVKQQLRPLFPDETSFGKFMKGAGNEDLMFQTKQQVIGGSDTARRVAQDTHGESDGILGPLVGAGIALKTGEPMVAVGSAIRGIKGLSNFLNKATPEMNRQIAQILTNPNAPENQELLQQIIARVGRAANRRPLSLPGQIAAGALSSVPGLPTSNSGQ